MSTEPVGPFPRALAGYCAAVLASALILVGVLLTATGAPAGGPLVALSGLAVFAMHRGVEGEGVSFLPNSMVFMAAVVVFDDADTLAGAVIVAMVGGIYLPALRRHTWGWNAFNSGVWGLSAGAAVGVFALLPEQASDIPLALVAFLLPTLAWFVANWLLVAFSYVVEDGSVRREVLTALVSNGASEVPFTLLGFFLGGLYLSLGPAVLLLVIVPIIIAREVFASYKRVKESHEETVGMLIRALEAKDKYTSGHSERVATYARYIGEELNFMPARMERLRFAALMHDIGKLVVPNQLLNKPGRLTEEEFAKVRLHEKVSVQMLSHIDFLRPIAAATHGDSMKFIPDDDDHPIEPYIVMIADAYDAMTSTRSYRKALPQEVAFQELRDKAGIQFHPECVEALIHAIEKRNEKHGAGYETQSEFLDAPEAGLGSAGLGDLLPSDAQ